RSLPDRFESETRIQLVRPAVQDPYIAGAARAGVAERLPAITERVLNSDRLQQIADGLHLYGDAAATGEDVVARIRRDLRIRVASNDSFTLTYSAPDATTASAVVERLGAAFVDE